ncbi:MAG TPA: phasin family protein [Candidatus Competibacteraceae bacterium]|mgnify:FL=1|nr:MAG: poly(hydroxyalkanoate) granule-associated protein [Candidatus Competibacteraceae bacterium]HOB60884.1 phasin family protein [Candidatus Competibacteraceae bacterium]HQA25103.1 phasin family protein [Candidatus Competibacteraceae bacterium]HQD55102.1 phasin family protein [Candidatus Competibacteraceae bacterium]
MTTNALKSLMETPAAANIRESANRIWLAGLGAFAKTQEEGEKLFQSLVTEGEAVEQRARKAAEAQFEDAKGKVVEFRGKANQQFDRLEELFQERVAQVLTRLGIPTQEDIQELTKRVEALNESILALKK